MILIADSGSTKSEWTLLQNNNVLSQKTLQGINPYQQSIDQIGATIRQMAHTEVEQIHFYGAGCRDSAHRAILHTELKRTFYNARYVEVETDLMGTARATCQHHPGIACLLGTGSNTGVYDGEKIVKQSGGYGFILGDEGSGAVMGKLLIKAFLHKKLPAYLSEELRKSYDLSPKSVLQKVYKSPWPNRYLAAFAPFISKHRKDDFIQRLLQRHYGEFFENLNDNFSNYSHLPLHKTGSIAWHFKEVIEAVGEKYNFKPGLTLKSPMEGLIAYHSTT